MTTFQNLPFAVQREVLRLAQLGERHPDADVARAAYRWAEAETARQRGTRGLLRFVADFVSGSIGGTAGDELNKAAQARSILKLGDPDAGRKRRRDLGPAPPRDDHGQNRRNPGFSPKRERRGRARTASVRPSATEPGGP